MLIPVLIAVLCFSMFIVGVFVGFIIASRSITKALKIYKTTKGYQPTKGSGSGKPPKRV